MLLHCLCHHWPCTSYSALLKYRDISNDNSLESFCEGFLFPKISDDVLTCRAFGKHVVHKLICRSKEKFKLFNRKLSSSTFQFSLRGACQDVLLPEGDREHHCDFFCCFIPLNNSYLTHLKSHYKQNLNTQRHSWTSVAESCAEAVPSRSTNCTPQTAPVSPKSKYFFSVWLMTGSEHFTPA